MIRFHKSKLLSLLRYGLPVLIVSLLLPIFTLSSFAAFNPQISYQGKLTDASDSAVADGDYNFRFRLCTGISAGACSGSVVMDETYIGSDKVSVSDGLFTVMLGSVSSTLDTVDFNQDLYLEVQVGGSGTPTWETLSPVKRLATVPNAFNAQKFDGLATTSFLRSDITNSGAIFTAATTTNSTTTNSLYVGASLGLNSEYFTDLTGLGLAFDSGSLRVATTSLGLLTTDVAEGSNLYWTSARSTSSFDTLFASNIAPYSTQAYNTSTYLSLVNWFATTSAPQLATLSGLTSIGSSGATAAVQGSLTVASNATTTGYLTVGSAPSGAVFSAGNINVENNGIFGGYVSTTGNIQTASNLTVQGTSAFTGLISGAGFTSAFDTRISSTWRAQLNGLASLGADGKVPMAQLNPLVITNTYVTSTEAGMLGNSAAHIGDVTVRTDLSKSYILTSSSTGAYAIAANWQELLSPTNAIISVNGLTGSSITLSTDNINEGLANYYYTEARFNSSTNAIKGFPNGLASLGADGKVPTSQIGALPVADTFVVAATSSLLAVAATKGDIGISTDENKTYILQTDDPTVWSNWVEILSASSVTSVNGLVGVVTLTTTNIAEGTNQYWTQGRFDTALAGATTWTGDLYVSGGNVGIGIASTTEALEVMGNASTSNNLYVGNSLYVGHSNGTDNDNIYFSAGSQSFVWSALNSRFELSANLLVNDDITAVGNAFINGYVSTTELLVHGNATTSGFMSIGISVPAGVGTDVGDLNVQDDIAVGGDGLFGGNIGIGTTTPVGNLSFGAINALISPDTINGADNKSLTLSGGGGNSITFGARITLQGNEYSGAGDLKLFTGNAAGSDMEFYGSNEANADELNMIIKDDTGFVGIGTSTPWGKLSVGNSAGGSTPLFVVASSTGSGVTSTNFIVDSFGNVGIGTATPTNDLHVNGNARIGELGFIANWPVIWFNAYYDEVDARSEFTTSDSAFALYHDQTNDLLKIVYASPGTAGDQVPGSNIALSVNTSGYIGIGTTTPQSMLTVSGDILIENGSTLQSLVLKRGGAEVGRISDANYDLTVQSASDIRFNANGSAEKMIITSGGNVGIGTTTPWGRLSVGNSAGGSTPLFVVASSTGSGVTSTNFIVDSFGNVGIGTIPTTAKLEVDAGSNSTGLRLFGLAEASEIADIYVGNGGQLVLSLESSSDSSPYIEVNANDNDYGLVIRESNAGSTGFANLYQNDATVDYLNIVVGDTNAVAGLIINDDNNVGVGTTTPWGTLSVEMDTTNPAFVVSNTGSSTPSLFVGGVNNNGYVGIGTITPNYALEVVGSASTTNLYTPVTSGGNVGIIYHGTDPFIHTAKAAGTSGYNTFLGVGAGNLTFTGSTGTQGSVNTVVGASSGSLITTGDSVTIVGGNSGSKLTSAVQTTVVGAYALQNNISSHFNTAVGAFSLYNATGGSNSAFGHSSGRSITSGTFNTFIGRDAGYGGGQKVDAVNSIAIGYSALTTASNQVVVGSTTVTQTLLNGSVGIATTSPFGKLSVYGIGSKFHTGFNMSTVLDLDTSGSVTNQAIRMLSYGSTAAWGIVTGASDGGLSFVTSTLDGSGSAPGQIMTIKNSGNVGIGTTAPLNTFHVVKDTVNLASAVDANYAVRISEGANNNRSLLLGVDNANGYAAIQAMDSGTSWVTVPLSLMPHGGKVGIGKTVPATALDVVGTASSTGLVVNGNATTTGVLAVGLSNGGDSVLELKRSNRVVWTLGNDAPTDLFTISTSTLGTNNILTISSTTGNVTIGNVANSATAKFSVYYSSSVWGAVNSSTGAWLNGSDLRLKTNITDLAVESPLQKVLDLRPVRYDWKAESASSLGRHIGFIAQEVETLFPELVFTGENGLKSISYAEFAPILAGAIKEQQSQISLLQASLSSTTPVSTSSNSQSVAVTQPASNQFQSLSVSNSAVFYGTITVIGEAGFESKVVFKNEVEFQGHITVDKDTAGTARIPAGATTTKIIFDQPYALVPKIVANLQSSGTPIFADYLIASKATSSFEIILREPSAAELYFDWIALAADGTVGQVAGAVETAIVGGCTYQSALNYNASATADDGSCSFLSVQPVAENPPASDPPTDSQPPAASQDQPEPPVNEVGDPTPADVPVIPEVPVVSDQPASPDSSDSPQTSQIAEPVTETPAAVPPVIETPVAPAPAPEPAAPAAEPSPVE